MNKVVVLMSTYNGEKYLRTQLDSILDQRNVNVEILVRDDGSTDSTIEILKEYESKGLLKWYTGENLRPAKSFMNLIINAPDAEYYAFSDQDDVWMESKLINAVDMLKQHNNASLYYCNALLVDENLNVFGENVLPFIPNFYSGLSYGKAALGCSMVFNKELMKMLKTKIPENIIMHDAWVTNVCQIIHGNIIRDDRPLFYYRQHSNNQVGGKRDFISTARRKFNFIKKNKNLYLQHWKSLHSLYYTSMDCKTKNEIDTLIHYNDSLINRINIIHNKEILKEKDTTRNIYYRLMFLGGLF